jgi:hypothetical protein
MNSTKTANRPTDAEPRLWRDWMAALFLFLATAAVVVWQNSRLGVLWDLSAILENSYRISRGDVPYRDFPLPFAPLTFLIQAALIKLTGRVFFHHVLYCAAVGGVATVLTWRILLNLLRGTVVSARLVAFLLSAPLTALGIYCIFPHPFYDPDCTFAILVCILLLQQLERKGLPPLRSFLTGAVLIVPLFVKQNAGLAFLGSAGLALTVLMGLEAWRRRPLSGYAWLMAGAAAGLVSALLLIHRTAGLANYKRWTVQFAASRRMPPLADMLAVYQDHVLLWWIAAFMAGALLLWLNQQGKGGLALLSSSLMSVPFAWTLIYMFIRKDSSERAERLLALWPFLLIVSFVFALLSVRRRAGITLVLPYILIGTVQGAFLSQQLWGSTYALWPLLMLLIASTIMALVAPPKQRSAWEIVPLTSVVAVSMLVSGGNYVWSHERLDYARLSEGKMVRSTLPALAGLSVRGLWIPHFEELVRFTERKIPREEGLLMIPGEDLFYYTTGRHPRFPVLMFDHTLNPYSPETILELSRARETRWLVIKQNLQLWEEPVEDKDRLLELLRQDFKKVESINVYDVYRRRSSADCEDDRTRKAGPAPADRRK